MQIDISPLPTFLPLPHFHNTPRQGNLHLKDRPPLSFSCAPPCKWQSRTGRPLKTSPLEDCSRFHGFRSQLLDLMRFIFGPQITCSGSEKQQMERFNTLKRSKPLFGPEVPLSKPSTRLKAFTEDRRPDCPCISATEKTLLRTESQSNFPQ